MAVALLVQRALFDPAAVQALRDVTPTWLVLLLVALSYFGSVWFITPVLVASYVVGARQRVATWMGIVFGSYALRSLAKSLNSLDRPPVEPPIDPAEVPAVLRPLYSHPTEISTTAFPSGHVMAATTFWSLFVLDTRLGTRRDRLLIAASVVLVVALSRVVVGAHWVGDVLGGLLFGLAYVGLALWLVRGAVDRVGASFVIAGTIAVIALLASDTVTGRTVLGSSIGALVAWSGRSLLDTEWTRSMSTPSRRVLGVGAAAVTGLAALVTALDGHPVALTLAPMVGMALLLWVPQVVAVDVRDRLRIPVR